MRALVRFPTLVLTVSLLLLSGGMLGASLPVSHHAHVALDADGAAAVGEWSAPFDGEVPAVNMILLHNGKVLYWSGLESSGVNGSLDWIFFTAHPLDGVSRIVDLSTGPPTVTIPASAGGAGEDLFCSGQTILPDGRVLTAGGTTWHDLVVPEPFLDGSNNTRIYDPATDTWTRAQDMVNWRWYPSVISAADGDAMAVSGIFHLSKPDSMVTQMESFEAGDWDVVAGGDRLLPLYPRVSVVPGGPLKGDLFYNTVATLWGPAGEHPLEAAWSLQQSYDAVTGWSYQGPSVFGARQHGASVMLTLSSGNGYAPRILAFGGSLARSIAATPVAELADLSTAPPTNTVVPPMAYPRWHLNGLVLPDGDVLAVGGGLYDNVYIHGQDNVPVLPAEIFDVETGTWKEVAAMTVPRMYHSTAVLLPDGRVLVGGHAELPNPWPQAREEIGDTGIALDPQRYETRLEIYSPPYLFRGTRPVIDDAPTEIGYGDGFALDVSSLGTLDSVTLIRPSATTHSFDSTARAIDLDVVSVGGGSVTVTAPPDGDVAPPGWYMLFVKNTHPDGPVPSVARWVHLT